MTIPQIKDYERVFGHTIFLKMHISAGYPDGVADEELLNLPLKCAISDMEMVVSDGIDAHSPATIRKAKWYLQKYNKELRK